MIEFTDEELCTVRTLVKHHVQLSKEVMGKYTKNKDIDQAVKTEMVNQMFADVLMKIEDEYQNRME